MKVMVMRTKNKDSLYKVGERYTVADQTSITYIVRAGKRYMGVDKDDCEVIG